MDFWFGGTVQEWSSVNWTAEPWIVGLGAGLGLVGLFLLYWTRRNQPKVGLEMILWSAVLSLLLIGLSQPQLISDMGSTVEGSLNSKNDNTIDIQNYQSALQIDGSTINNNNMPEFLPSNTQFSFAENLGAPQATMKEQEAIVPY